FRADPGRGRAAPACPARQRPRPIASAPRRAALGGVTSALGRVLSGAVAWAPRPRFGRGGSGHPLLNLRHREPGDDAATRARGGGWGGDGSGPPGFRTRTWPSVSVPTGWTFWSKRADSPRGTAWGSWPCGRLRFR